jgi:hypothetical protein
MIKLILNKKAIMFLLCLFLLYSCNTKNEGNSFSFDSTSKEYKIAINKETIKKNPISPNYPAVGVSLTNHSFFQVKDTIFKGKYGIFFNKSPEFFSDKELYLEPRECEIGLFCNDTYSKLMIVGVGNWENYTAESIKKIHLEYEMNIGDNNIKEGLIFIVRNNKGLLFKVRIDSFNKEKEEISLTYKLLE